MEGLPEGERARLEELVRAERGWPEGEDTPLRRAVLPGLIAAKAAVGSQCA